MSTTLPSRMYYFTTATADHNNVGGIWFNSLYKTAPTAAPSGTTGVNWVRVEVNTTANARFATGFTPNKSELFPFYSAAIAANFNLTQNPGY